MLSGVVALLLFLGAAIATNYSEEQYGFYGYEGYDGLSSSGDLYDEVGELPDYLTDSELPVSIPAVFNKKFQVLCSQTHMTLVISSHAIPNGLELFLHQKNMKKNCLKFQKNRTTTEYRVDRGCRGVVTSEQIKSNLLYRHVALLVQTGTTLKSFTAYSTLYSVVMECESIGVVGGNGTLQFPRNSKLRSEKKIFEHRVSRGQGKACQSSSCRYGSLCLPQHEVDGFFCDCAKGRKCDLRCPPNYYGCSSGDNNHLQCISMGWLCDEHADCPMQDDEKSCTEIWSPWSPWSKCVSRCGGETQKRSRRCDVSFLSNPNRCKLFRNALGCSRRCTLNEQVQHQNRTCGRERCSRVQCNRHHMTIVIPREPAMTSQSLERRMTLGGDPLCRPSYNNTHVTFVTFLHKCNTKSKVVGDLVIYSNEVHFSSEPDPNSLITRDLGHSYAITCRFQRRQSVAMRKKHTRTQESIEIAVLNFAQTNNTGGKYNKAGEVEHSASGSGEFEFKMDLYEDVNYRRPFPRSSYPLVKKLREELFVAVHFHTVDDDLTLMIDRCVATPSASNDQSQLAYPFIEDGCPVDGTVRLYINDVSPRSGCFSIEAFKFSDASNPYVYFQCDVIVCDISDEFCRPNCSNPGRKRRSLPYADLPPDDEVMKGHVVQGPIEIKVDDFSLEVQGAMIHRGTPSSKRSKSHISHSVITISVIGGVGCLIIGILAGAYGRGKCRYASDSV